jgi:hypothetical protein
MSVCLFCVCVVLRVGSGIATGWSPVQGVQQTAYRIKKLKNLPRPNKGLYSNNNNDNNNDNNKVIIIIIKGPPRWSSGHSSWLQIQRPWFDSRRYQVLWEVVGLEQGPLSLVSTTEELLERKSSGSGLGNRDYGRRDPSLWPCGTLYPQKLALTSPTSGGRSVGIVRARTQATELIKRTSLWVQLRSYWKEKVAVPV